jgi:hypothetical protein
MFSIRIWTDLFMIATNIKAFKIGIEFDGVSYDLDAGLHETLDEMLAIQ